MVMNFMRGCRGRLIVFVAVFVWVVQLTAGGVIEDKQGLLAGLEMLSQAHEAANAGVTHYAYEGRVFTEQRSPSPEVELPPEKRIEPVWEDFCLVGAGQKRRYEKVNRENGNLSVYAIDDGEKITNLGGFTIVRIFSRDPAQDHWNELTRDYNRYTSMMPWWGNLEGGVQGLATLINEGHFDAEEAAVTLERDADGMFVLHGKVGGDECTCWIDPEKGFNIVKAHGRRDYAKKDFHSDLWQEAAFARNEDGYWYLESGRVWGEENGVLLERRLVVEKAQFGEEVQVPEGFFDPKSLERKPDIYTVDYRFSPPLEVGGPATDPIDIDALVDARLSLTEVATVATGKGTVSRDNHPEMIKALKEERAGRARRWGGLGIGLALVGATGFIVTRSIIRRRKA